ncbi:MAG: peptidylprolyl isomerase [Patescibacteria group bacterium]
MADKKYLFLIIILLSIAVAFIFIKKPEKEEMIQDNPTPTPLSFSTPTPTSNPQKKYDSPPEMTISVEKKYQAAINTSEGKMVFELFADEAPITVNNFVFLSKENFYQETVFHRIINGFMIQGGDPTGTGTGGPGYKFEDEPVTRDYERGIMAMANSGPDTNGCQFFIMHQNYNLPKNYTIFGKLIEGEEVLDKIANTPVSANMAGETSKPAREVKINSIEITEE